MKKVFGVLTAMVLALGFALGWRLHVGRAHEHAPSGGSGVVEATEVDLSARLSAPLVAVEVREGERVEKGQVLAKLDCADPMALVDEARARLAMARAAVDAAKAGEAAAAGNSRAAWQSAAASAAQVKALEAERANAEKESERLAALHTEGAVSDSLFDTTQTRVVSVNHQEAALSATTKAATARAAAANRTRDAAAAQTTSAEQAVSAAEAAVRRAEILVSDCTIKSPIDGVVLHRNYEPGELVLPGAKLLTIVDIKDAKATFYLPNAELSAAAPARAVVIHADAWPGESFPGTIARVSAKAEFTPRNIQTREDRDRLVYAVEVTHPQPGRETTPRHARRGLHRRNGAMSHALMEAKGVVRRFGSLTAVRGVDLHVNEGEVFGLVGPDGAGKTTLLRVLVGMLDPSSGSASIFGRPATSEASEVRGMVGYMPQQYSLYGDLSVDENLSFFASMFCLDKRLFRERRERLLHLTRLERFGARRADALSGGMYKKLALACALLHRPRVLVLDEPTNGVDPVSRREFWDLLATFVAEGMGVLISTPYMDEAARCSRVGLMHHGRILEQGVPRDMLRGFRGGAFRVEAHDREGIASWLETQPAVVSVSPAGGGLRVVVAAGHVEALRAAGERLGARFEPAHPTFEDVFLARLREDRVRQEAA